MALRCSCAGIERTPRSRQALQSPGRAPIEAAMTPEASSPSPPESSPGPSRGALRSGLRADGLPHKVLGPDPTADPPRNANHPADVTGADIFGPVQLRRQWVAIHPQSADPQPGSSVSSEAPRSRATGTIADRVCDTAWFPAASLPQGPSATRWRARTAPPRLATGNSNEEFVHVVGR